MHRRRLHLDDLPVHHSGNDDLNGGSSASAAASTPAAASPAASPDHDGMIIAIALHLLR